MVTINPYGYEPNAAAAMIFVVLFAAVTLWHAYIMARLRVWYFVVLVIGGLFETAGYICRFLAHDNTSNLILFVVQTLVILVAPALFAASIYMVLGRLIILVRAESYSPVRPTWLTKVFVGGDVLSFLIQIVGSSNLSSNFNLAKTIILIGLIVQIIFFGLFVVVAFIIDRRLSQAPTPTAIKLDAQNAKLGWRGVLRVIYIASAMIFVRSIFRMVEYCGSSDSSMMRSEAYIYVCDSTLMFLALAILAYFHPGKYYSWQAR